MSLCQRGIFKCCQRSNKKPLEGFPTYVWFSKVSKRLSLPPFLGKGKETSSRPDTFSWLSFILPTLFNLVFFLLLINGKLIFVLLSPCALFCRAHKTLYYYLCPCISVYLFWNRCNFWNMKANEKMFWVQERYITNFKMAQNFFKKLKPTKNESGNRNYQNAKNQILPPRSVKTFKTNLLFSTCKTTCWNGLCIFYVKLFFQPKENHY